MANYRREENSHIWDYGDGFAVRFDSPRPGRYGQVYGEVWLTTSDGIKTAVLAQGRLDLSDARARSEVARWASTRNGAQAEDYERVLLDCYIDLKTYVLPNLASSFGFIPLQQLLDEPEEMKSELVRGLLEYGKLYAVSAKPKVGKSLLVMNLAVAVDLGQLAWLGRPTVAGKALFLPLEDSRTTVKRRFLAMLQGARPGSLAYRPPEGSSGSPPRTSTPW